MSSDPFSKVYDGLWEMLENHSGFTDKVKIGNRQKFNGSMRSPKSLKAVLTADRPVVGLVVIGAVPQLHRASNLVTIHEQYEFVVITGDRRVTESLYPVSWEMVKAMTKWKTYLSSLTWNSKTFVHLGHAIGFTESLVDDDTHSIRGWVGRWQYEVQMHFKETDMQTV